MVSFEEEGAVTAKIIDLGLAKVADESGAQTTISASGAFAGTPEFASPEQIIGGEVDIRSDLYSLGVSLWQMLTGQVPFGGSLAVVMAQHQHAALPLERLAGVPQPVANLIEVLLSKDPRRRFQTPAELLKTLPALADAVVKGSTITYTSLGQPPDRHGYSAAHKPTTRGGSERISIAKLPVTRNRFFWPRRGHNFSERRMGESGCECRHDSGLGWCGKVHARQPLASGDGCRTLSFC